MNDWKPVREQGRPPRRCDWGGAWRCQETAVWWRENGRRSYALCDEHRQRKDVDDVEIARQLERIRDRY